MDAWAFSSFYVAAILCFGCSATFHTSLCHSQVSAVQYEYSKYSEITQLRMLSLQQAVAEAYNKLDYVGIGAFHPCYARSVTSD